MVGTVRVTAAGVARLFQVESVHRVRKFLRSVCRGVKSVCGGIRISYAEIAFNCMRMHDDATLEYQQCTL